MQEYIVNKNLRLRSYESGYVVEKKAIAKDGLKHWTGVLWYSTIVAALVGLSDYLVRQSKEPLPQALKDATNALRAAQLAVFSDTEEK